MMAVVFALLTVLLFYGVMDLLLRAVFFVLFCNVKSPQTCVMFVSGDLENNLFKIRMQRFFLPKDAMEWVLVGEQNSAFSAQRCEEKDVRFFTKEEFVKLVENGLQPTDKLL